MIPRYTPDDFLALWSDATRFETWLEVELAACDAMEEANLVPRGTAAAIRGARLVIVPGVGHYLPAAVYPQVADEVRALADRAATAAPEPG